MTNPDIYLYILEKLNQIKYPSPIPLSKEILEYSQENKSTIDKIINRLSEDEPWEYICGKAFYCGEYFKVSPAVLIPRIETEQIVKTVVKELKNENDNVQIIDTGTGSGAIILSIERLAKKPSNIYIGTDISLEALKIAKSNRKNGKVNFIHADLINSQEIKPDMPTYIVANLPYIPSGQVQLLQNSVKNYEPHLALDGGDSGLEIYEKLFEQIIQKKINLKYAIFEFDPNTIEGLKTLIEKYPQFDYEIEKDIYNQNRFLKIKRRPVS
jgi:release factor glutamine methyltransferase